MKHGSKAQAQEPRSTNSKYVTPTHTQFAIAKVFSTSAGNDDHGCLRWFQISNLKYLKSQSLVIKQKRRTVDQRPSKILYRREPLILKLFGTYFNILSQLD